MMKPFLFVAAVSTSLLATSCTKCSKDDAAAPASSQAQADRDELLRATTIAVVATNARLTKAQANKVAQMADDGLARAIRPAHGTGDGDTVFALANGTVGVYNNTSRWGWE
jgi:L-aminopeptidase/D-esterase-like protein